MGDIITAKKEIDKFFYDYGFQELLEQWAKRHSFIERTQRRSKIERRGGRKC